MYKVTLIATLKNPEGETEHLDEVVKGVSRETALARADNILKKLRANGYLVMQVHKSVRQVKKRWP